MLTIRLQRGGKRNNPQYKLVLAEKTAANQKQFTEILGSYNPHTKALIIRDNDRLNYWLNDQHVELSETVHNLLVTKELLKADKVHAFRVPKKEVAAAEQPAPAETEAEPAEVKAEAAPETTETSTESAVEETNPAADGDNN